MKIISQSISSHIRPLVVCCVHGDERFGLTVFHRLSADTVRRPRLSLVLANIPAIIAQKRYVESDLNRSFPGNAEGTMEERLATDLLPHVMNATHIIDIHTTTADIKLLPIITCLEPNVQTMLAHTNSTEIAYIDPPHGRRSLIGQTACGVSMEFGNEYCHDAAYQDVLRVIDGILGNTTPAPRNRHLFHINGFIPNTETLRKDIKNFECVPELDCYPVLLHEKAYIGSHAMKATLMEQMAL